MSVLESKQPTQKPDYWFYSTIALVSIIVISAIVYFAYQFGRNSNSEVKEENSVVSNTQTNKTTSTNFNTQVVSSSNNSVSPIANPVNMVTVSQPTSTTKSITGEMFVVTRGRENIKLALVDVCAVSESAILSWIKSKKDAAKAFIQKEQEKIESLKRQKEQLAKDLQAAQSRDETWRLEDKERELSNQLRLADIQLYYWVSPEYYLKGLTICEARTKTDSDGKFKLDLPSSKRYALAAQTDRKIPGSSETYWWLIWTNPQLNPQTVTFTNDNLMAENPSEKVMQIDRYISKY